MTDTAAWRWYRRQRKHRRRIDAFVARGIRQAMRNATGPLPSDIPGRNSEPLRAYLALAQGEIEPPVPGRDYRVTRAVDPAGRVVFESQVEPPGAMVDRSHTTAPLFPLADNNATIQG